MDNSADKTPFFFLNQDFFCTIGFLNQYILLEEIENEKKINHSLALDSQSKSCVCSGNSEVLPFP